MLTIRISGLKDLFLLGQTVEGLDITEFDDISTELLHQYYGVHGQRSYRLPSETGAGHPTNEQVASGPSDGSPMEEDDVDEASDSDDESSPLEKVVANSIQTNIRHAPVKVQRHSCPFDHEQVVVFGEMLAAVLVSPLQPVDFGSWATTEGIPLGRNKELRVDLAGDVWKARARNWVLAVELYTRLTQ